jgi:hypothetical protein
VLVGVGAGVKVGAGVLVGVGWPPPQAVSANAHRNAAMTDFNDVWEMVSERDGMCMRALLVM